MSKESDLSAAFKDIISGTFGGVAQVLAGHPLDTIKVRLQTQVTVPGQPPQFNGMVDCFKKTLQIEGFRGLYKGSASPLAGAMAHNATLFFVYGQSKKYIGKVTGRGSNLLPKDCLVAGAVTGFVANIVETPIDLLKVKLQSQVGKGEYTGVWDALKKLLAQRGISG
eukprot:TRINITY_DN2344_c0_g1_i2.p1 TRINITY_DN2344_c0_g1~~TRINITY_DN2344_c0_g1_i2.p1  ORF type:complete len:167 (-),score=38.19 TRINITY_DN2344_c0_g1_i2:69-569(-)